MRRRVMRRFGLFAVATDLLIPAMPAIATSPPPDADTLARQNRTTTLANLSRELQVAIVDAARTRPGAPKLAAPGVGPQAGPSNEELNLICFGDWFVTWDENSNGIAIMGTFKLYCDGQTIPVG